MSTFPIFVPSKARADNSTAKLLTESGLPFTLVVEPQDRAAYAEQWPKANIDSLPENDRGIAYVRNCILELARSKKMGWFWMLDDDITAFYEVSGGKCRKCIASVALLGAQGIFATPEHYSQAALEYQQFAWSNKKGYAENGYCDVAVAIHSERSQPARYDPGVNLKEDRDFTMQQLANGYSTIRIASYAFAAPKNGSNGGGLQPVYASGREIEASLAMVRKWPGVCTQHTKPDGRPDVKINWKALRCPA